MWDVKSLVTDVVYAKKITTGPSEKKNHYKSTQNKKKKLSLQHLPEKNTDFSN